MHRPHPGWAENDAEDWVAAAAAAVPEVLCQAGLDADDVTGVCIVGQRDIVVLIDDAGSVLGPSIHWSDRRDPDGVQRLFDRIGRDRLLGVSGTPATPRARVAEPRLDRHPSTGTVRPRGRRAQSQGLRELSPDRRDRHRPHHSHPKPAQRLAQRRVVRDELCAASGIPRALLPDVRYDPWEPRAVLDERAATSRSGRRPVLAGGGGDDPSAVLGCGVAGPGGLGLVGSSSSTSWRVVAVRPTVSADGPLGVLPHVAPDRYLHEMVAMGTGTSLRWLREVIAPAGTAAPSYGDLLAAAAAVAPGAEGLLFYPYIEGGTVPYADDHVRAALPLGIEPHHTQAHLARAVIEGIAYQYPPLLDIIARAGHEIGRVTISDGEARSVLWNQIKADVMGRPMRAAQPDVALSHA